MTDYPANLASRGRVTIPKLIRDELGLRPFDKIHFFWENGDVKLGKVSPAADGLPAPLVTPFVEDVVELAQGEKTLDAARNYHGS